jgi:hypothetical protein
MSFKVGDFIKESMSVGLVLTCGPKTFDVIWEGGSTSRYRHHTRDIWLAAPGDLVDRQREHLLKEAAAARAERAAGARVKRGQVWPSR